MEANVVKYYQNDVLFYISSVAPTLPLLADVSINSINGTVTNALVTNLSDGAFAVSASGATPTGYQWQVNEVNVMGANMASYNNTTLGVNDRVRCLVTFTGPCGAVIVPSNQLTNRDVSYPTSFDFFIQGSVASSGCNTVEEQVRWRLNSLQNVNATNNNLTKIQSNGNWDGGAASFNTVEDNGYMSFRAAQTNRAKMVGLSTTNANANFNTIQYAVYLRGDGNVEIFESGNSRGTFGNYLANDIFKVAVELGVVKYYKNNVLFYISSVTPTLPLLVDVSINSVDGTVNDVLVSNYSTGTFTASAINAGPSPTYQWYVNNVLVSGATNPTFNMALNDGDFITCRLTPDLGGCTEFESNRITNRLLTSTPSSIDFYVQGTVAASGCNTVEEQVRWRLNSLQNVNASTNNLAKIQSNGNWDGGAASFNTVANNGYMSFRAAQTNRAKMVGLSASNANSNFNTIQYAVYLRGDGNFEIFESGNSRGTFGSYLAADIFKVAIETGVVKYYRNDNLFYISSIAPSLPLLVDVSINSINGTVDDVIVSNYSTGTFTATAIGAGAAPSYQWLVNGAPIMGATTNVFNSSSLASGDELTCVLTPDLAGCGPTITYTSNIVTNRFLTSTPTSIDFYIQGTAAAAACNTVDEQVRWQINSLQNVNATGNSLRKIQSNGNWDGGAYSFNSVSNNGYFEFTATETGTLRMVGLSSSNANANFNTIQFAVYLRGDNQFEVYESGNSRGTFGTYSSGNIFRIAVEANVVRYYRNGTLFYISSVSPTLPLRVDVSINTVNGTVTNAIVSNFSTGTFTAVASNAGASPSYQWKIDGVDVGTNSTIYVNTGLTDGQEITCVLTPDLAGCGPTATYESNMITNNLVPTPTNIDFYVAGTTSTTACTEAIEEVVWRVSSLTNTAASGNTVTKIQSGGNWDGGAASWNTVNNNGYLQFTATQINTLRMVGLSTSNTNANFNTIQYAIYLRGDSQFEVYESGSSRGNFGAYALNDVFRISVEGFTVRYFRNGVIFYTSNIAPTLPLLLSRNCCSWGDNVSDLAFRNCVVAKAVLPT